MENSHYHQQQKIERDQDRDYNPQTNMYYRRCYYCQEFWPESKEKRDRRNPDYGLLMDSELPGLEHWKVCEVQQGAETAIENRKKFLKYATKRPIPQQPQQQQQQQEKNNNNHFLLPQHENEMSDKQKLDYILESFDNNLKQLHDNQTSILQSIQNHMTIMNREISSLNSEIRSIKRHLGIVDT